MPGVGDVVESALRVTCSWCWIMREAARVSGSILTTSTLRPCRAHLKPCRTSSMVLPVWRKQRWDSVSAPVFVPVLQYNHCSTEYPPPTPTPTAVCLYRHAKISHTQVKDPAVHVRDRSIMKTQKQLSMHGRFERREL